ncbi:MAG: hypothetical protein ACYCV5_03810 [Acidimicrobiales bacterium]
MAGWREDPHAGVVGVVVGGFGPQADLLTRRDQDRDHGWDDG